MSDLAPGKRLAVVPRPGSRLPAAVVRAGIPVLARLATEGNGTAEALVEESKRPESPFHSTFRWGATDKELAHEHRLSIGRQVWASVEVRFTADDGSTATARAFTAVRVEGEGMRYVPTPEVVRNPALRDQILKSAKADLESMRRKHSMLRQLFTRGEIVQLFEEQFFAE